MPISSLKTREYGGFVDGSNNNFPRTGTKKKYALLFYCPLAILANNEVPKLWEENMMSALVVGKEKTETRAGHPPSKKRFPNFLPPA